MAQVTTTQDFPDGLTARPSQRAQLHSTRYTSRDFMAREWAGIWTRCWLFAGLVSDLPEPGDFFVYN